MWSSIGSMQEFSSVTASSYDADALAPLLSEKSAEGWEVVSIVSAGTNIVAYLVRESDGAAVADDVVAEEAVAEAVVAEEIVAEAVVEEADDDASPLLPGAAAAAAVVADEPAAVDEPAGWAAAPDSADDTAAATESVDDLAAQVAAEEPAAEPVEEAAAADSAVPAGWYADPSGRFELRYWDGGAWTEHVSRAGQQFTDPPVA